MDEAKKAAEAINTKLTELEGNIGKAATKTQIDDATKALNDFKTENKTALEGFVPKADFDTVKEQVETLKADLEQANLSMVELAEKGTQKDTNPILDIIKNNKEEIELSVTQKGRVSEFTVKADVLRASVDGSTDAMRLNNIGQLAHRQFQLRNLFSTVTVGKNQNGVVRYSDWDEATIARAAAMVAEGAVFPESTASWKEHTLELKKIGDSIPVSEEMIYDQERFAAELDDFLSINVAIVEDDQLYGADGTGQNATGLATYAPAFVPVAANIQDASLYDLAIKVSESITRGKKSKNSPNFALMNIVDINRMLLKKNGRNDYIAAPFFNRETMRLGNIQIIESNAVTPNSMVVGDSRFGRIYESGEGYTVSTQHVNDQYIKDMMTMKARKRMNLLIREADKNAFSYVADIDAAIITIGA